MAESSKEGTSAETGTAASCDELSPTPNASGVSSSASEGETFGSMIPSEEVS
jgi:hypothetical protein